MRLRSKINKRVANINERCYCVHFITLAFGSIGTNTNKWHQHSEKEIDENAQTHTHVHFGWLGVLFCSMNESNGANANFISRRLEYMVIARIPHHITHIRTFRCALLTVHLANFSHSRRNANCIFGNDLKQQKNTLNKNSCKKSYSKNIDIRSSISGAFEQDEKEMIANVLTLAVFCYLFFWHLVFTRTKHINLSK